MRKDQVNRDQLGELRGSGRVDESGRSKQPIPATQQPEREEITGRRRTEDDDLVLHDDDEAELDLPR